MKRNMNVRTTTIAILFSAAAICAVAEVVRAEDWPRFRGPNGAGISDVAFDAPITESNFAWRITLPGQGHSSPVVRGDRIYLTTADPETAKRIVLCLSAKDGSEVWRREFESKTFRQHADNSYASSTPAVDDVGVYVAWSTPGSLGLHAFDLDGKDLWQKDLGVYKSQHGSGASPMVVDDLVIMPDDQEGPHSEVVAFDHKTGQQRWKIDRRSSDKAEMSTPCLFHPKDLPPQLILSSKGTGVTAVDPKTGTIIWQVPDACVARTVGSAALTDDLVIQACGDGTTVREVVAIRPYPASNAGASVSKPQVAYHISKISPYVPTPVVKDGMMFMWADNGVVTCVKAETGETIWRERVGGEFYGSPVCAGETLWAMSRKGKLVGVSAAAQFKLVGELDLGEPTQATPAIANGRMYLRTQSHLICVKPPSGK
jgi:outer membrane protein assembly factor BamB